MLPSCTMKTCYNTFYIFTSVHKEAVKHWRHLLFIQNIHFTQSVCMEGSTKTWPRPTLSGDVSTAHIETWSRQTSMPRAQSMSVHRQVRKEHRSIPAKYWPVAKHDSRAVSTTPCETWRKSWTKFWNVGIRCVWRTPALIARLSWQRTRDCWNVRWGSERSPDWTDPSHLRLWTAVCVVRRCLRCGCWWWCVCCCCCRLRWWWWRLFYHC